MYIINIIKVKYKKKIIILKKDIVINIKEGCCYIVKYKQKPRIYISFSSHVQASRTSAILAKTPKCGHLLSAPPQYILKIRLTTTIYKRCFSTTLKTLHLRLSALWKDKNYKNYNVIYDIIMFL